MNPLFAIQDWPDRIDATVTAGHLAVIIGLPLAGYVCMVLDFRAYLRSLRRAMVVAGAYFTELPDWVRRGTPHCVLALGLTLPCTADEVLAAYRKKVKHLHPDRGGDRRKFLRLQRHFENAMQCVE